MLARCNSSCWQAMALLVAAITSGCALTGANTSPMPTTAVPMAAQPTKAPAAAPVSTAATTSTPTAAPKTPTPTNKKAATNSVPVVATDAAAVIPAAAQKQFDNALAALKSGQTSAAQSALQQLTRDYPSLAAPWINLGLIELKAGRNDAALNYFQQAVNHDAKSAVAQSYLGLGLRQAGKFKEAESAYLAALGADANYAQAHYNLGVLYDLYLQRPEQAVEQYESYQALLGTPDAKVASWIKDLKARLNSKSKAAGASS